MATSDGRHRVLSLTGAGEAIARELSAWDESPTTALAGVLMADRAATLQTPPDAGQAIIFTVSTRAGHRGLRRGRTAGPVRPARRTTAGRIVGRPGA